jgi:Pentapeptide repeats (8 copies)
METFEPPKYVATLIGAINDGAKAAQTGALGLAAIALYLFATAVSTTDEDMFLQHATTISQIGVQVPVEFSFAVAPIVFLTLHVFTLIRYNMLGANLRQLNADLELMVPRAADRERCRHLLANVEFVQAFTAPRASPLHSWFYSPLFFALIAVLPVAVILAVELSSLRYQNVTINWTQRVVLFIDLAVLIWFFYRRRFLFATPRSERIMRRAFKYPSLLALPALVIAIDLAWFNIPGADIQGVTGDAAFLTSVRRLLNPASEAYNPSSEPSPSYGETVRKVLSQPLDLLLCPAVHFGCRYLTVDHRTLVARVWNQQAVADLVAGSTDRVVQLAAIEPVYLRGRSLRFANLRESRLFGASLEDADLRGSDFGAAHLEGAQMTGAQLENANLYNVHLEGAVMLDAHMEGAQLTGAHLQGVTVNSAYLSGAQLNGAHLDGINGDGAHFEGASLENAQIRGGTFYGAFFQGADLLGADLAGSDLQQSRFAQANFSRIGRKEPHPELATDVGLGDLRDTDFSTPISRNDYDGILARVTDSRFRSEFVQAFAPPAAAAEQVFFKATAGPVLINDAQRASPQFANIQQKLSSDEDAFVDARVPYFVEKVISETPDLAENFVIYFRPYKHEQEKLACVILMKSNAGKIKLRGSFRTSLTANYDHCLVSPVPLQPSDRKD